MEGAPQFNSEEGKEEEPFVPRMKENWHMDLITILRSLRSDYLLSEDADNWVRNAARCRTKGFETSVEDEDNKKNKEASETGVSQAEEQYGTDDPRYKVRFELHKLGADLFSYAYDGLSSALEEKILEIKTLAGEAVKKDAE